MYINVARRSGLGRAPARLGAYIGPRGLRSTRRARLGCLGDVVVSAQGLGPGGTQTTVYQVIRDVDPVPTGYTVSASHPGESWQIVAGQPQLVASTGTGTGTTTTPPASFLDSLSAIPLWAWLLAGGAVFLARK